MLKAMPIDKLLRWALCEELPKGQPVSASAWDAVARTLALGTRIDVSHGGGDGLGIVPGDPHPDALIIAAELRKVSSDFVLGAHRLAQIIGPLSYLDADAFNALAPAPFNLPALLIRCAVLNPIDVPAIDPQPLPVMTMPHADGGRPVAIVFGVVDGDLRAIQINPKSRRYDINAEPRCHLQWSLESGEPIGAAFEARAEYAAWFEGLRQLADALGKRTDLIEYTAAAPSVAGEPWQTPAADLPATLPIVQGGAPVSSQIIPLAPKRKAPGKPIKSRIEQLQEDRAKARARDRAKATRERNRENADNYGVV